MVITYQIATVHRAIVSRHLPAMWWEREAMTKSRWGPPEPPIRWTYDVSSMDVKARMPNH
jgi:hypothetical protein